MKISNFYSLFFFIFAAFLSLPVMAETVNLDLEEVSLYDLVKIVNKDIDQTDYIIDTELLQHKNRFSISTKNIKEKNLKPFLDAILKREGFYSEKINNILYIQKTDKENPKIQYLSYIPKHRDSTYIIQSFRDVLPRQIFGKNNDSANTAQPATDTPTSGTSAADLANLQKDELILSGTSDQLEIFNRFIHEVDRPVPELSITAYVYEVSNTKSGQTAFNLTASLLGEKIGLNIGASNVLEHFINIRTLGISAIISALSSDTRYQVVSSPFLRVSDNKQARFNVGSDVPVLDSIVTSGNGQTQQSIRYTSSGILLTVFPRIKSDSIELRITQELSNFIRTQTGVNNSPTLIKRAVDTVVQAHDDDVIILGGLDENSDTKTRSGLPFLPSVLQSNSSNKTNSSIVVVMHVKRI